MPGLMNRFWHSVRQDTFALISFYYLLSIGLLAIIVPILPWLDATAFDPNGALYPHAPSLRHWFGTDALNRDILLRCITGAKISLFVGIVSAFISVSIGSVFGLISAYFGGWTDKLMMRFVDFMMAIPSLFLILTLQVIFSPSIITVVLVIGGTSWMGVARVVRSEVLTVKTRVYVTAAKARGIGTLRILAFYVFPQTLSPIIVMGTLAVAGAILSESVLSFLGLGVQPPYASWGNMLQRSLAYLMDAPWMAIAPGLLITCTVLAFNFLGDALRQMQSVKDENVRD